MGGGVYGEVSGGTKVWTHSATFVTEEVCLAPNTLRSVSQGGNPAGVDVGAGWAEVADARRQTMGRPDLDDTA